MAYLWKHTWLAWLGIGLLLGLLIGGLWPDTPLHAVATDRLESYAIATGFVDDEVEAIYFLDVLTGTLKAAVVSNQRGGFQAYYETNLNMELAAAVESINIRRRQATQPGSRGGPALPEVQMPQTPNYIMVTGSADVRRGMAGRTRPSQSLVYVAETNTGVVMAYLLPWDQSAHKANQPSGGKLVRWAGDQFTTALIRTP